MKFLDNFYYHKLRPKIKREFDHIYLVDKSSLIDGRVVNIFQHFGYDHRVYLPSFVKLQLQEMQKSKNFLESSKGKRGLLALDQLNKKLFEHGQDLLIYSVKPTVQADSIMIDLVHAYKTLINQLVGMPVVITCDSEFSKLLRVHKVGVISLNELANDLLDVVFIGEKHAVKLEALGREEGQATGYINGKSLIVVKKGAKYIGQTVPVTVVNYLQNEHGKLYFGELQWN